MSDAQPSVARQLPVWPRGWAGTWPRGRPEGDDGTVAVDLFAGIPVVDYESALAWYERLLGSEPSFLPNETEAVWEIAEHRYLFIEVRPEHAGHAMHTIFVDDFDARVQQMADRGIDPVERETYSNGVRKATYRDPDGNEIGFGGGPLPTGAG
jgi:catechol 2,3-dioxygenase-like lactoylglutathione lyase family enzyme